MMARRKNWITGAALALTLFACPAPPVQAQATTDDFRIGLAILEQFLKMIDQMDPEAKRIIGGMVCSFIEANPGDMNPLLKDFAARTCADLRQQPQEKAKPDVERTKTNRT